MSIPLASPGAAARYETAVVVVGSGTAGLSTAIRARQAGAAVIVIEKAPKEGLGGNTRFADAQMRFPHEADEFGARDYTVDEMYADLMRISRGRANAELVRTLCENARETAEWLTAMGLEWEAGYPHTAGYRRSPKSGGQGLVDLLYRRLEGLGGTIAYQTGAVDLILDGDGSIAGVRARSPEGLIDIPASGRVVAAVASRMKFGRGGPAGARST